MPNTQTSVPLYAQGEVLTAANLNLTNSGIPVFATTVTRDAAFGGAGEKTLAEGQFAYLEDSNATQYYDGAAWQTVNKFVQLVNSQVTSVATGTGTIPADDTIPQITEGDQYMTLAITPKSATNILTMNINVLCSVNTTTHVTCALFQDATANALAATAFYSSTSTGMMTIAFNHRMVAGTTSATTFRIRIGSATGNTVTFNGDGSNRKFGGVAASSITITESTP